MEAVILLFTEQGIPWSKVAMIYKLLTLNWASDVEHKTIYPG